MAKRWSSAEEIFLLENYPKKSIKYISEKLGRSIKKVYLKMQKMNINIMNNDLIEGDFILLSKAIEYLNITITFVKNLEKNNYIKILRSQKTRLLKKRYFEKLKDIVENYLNVNQVAKLVFYSRRTVIRFIKNNNMFSGYVKRIGNKYFLHKNCIDIFKKILGV